ncbi:MAG: DUF6326 family protein [Spirochaetaceae bacterium]
MKRENTKINIKVQLAAIWGSMMLLYIYCDIFSFMRPGHLESIIDGFMGPFPVTQTSLFIASLLMMIPGLMVLLSIILKSNINRLLNIIFGALYALVNIGNMIGETWAYYIFYGVVELILALLIIYFAWNWPKIENDKTSNN